MSYFNVLARLLDYPTQELKDHIGEIKELVATKPGYSDHERKTIGRFVSWIQDTDLMELEANYVDTFDNTPEHSLHLTHHSFGETRERGPALVDLSELYKGAGLATKEGELPDYLPLILEYVNMLDDMQISVFLGQTANVLELLADNLDEFKSPYAPLIRLIEGRGRLARSAA